MADRHAPDVAVVESVLEQLIPRAAPPPEGFLETLKVIAECSVALLALAYLAGWSFLATYYTQFGLSPFEFDFSVQPTAAFALLVVRHEPWVLIGGIAVSMIVYRVVMRHARAPATAMAMIVLLVTGIVAGTLRGITVAGDDMLDTGTRLSAVGFVAKTKAAGPPCLADGEVSCRLLLHAHGAYYFFVPRRTSVPPLFAAGNLNVFIAAESEIAVVHLRRGID